MKILISLLLLTASFTLFAQKAELVVKTDIACDHCAACGSCEALIAKTLYTNLKGIGNVSVDTKAETITVAYKDDKTTPDEIRKTIALAGYNADDVLADPKAYQALDGCCKRK